MSNPANIKLWLAEAPEPAVKNTLDRLARAPGVRHIAVMPDVHLAAGSNNGVAVATENHLYPAAVGSDIGCGFATVAFDGSAAPLARREAAETLLERLRTAVPVMRHKRRDGLPDLTNALAAENLSAPSLAAKAASEGRLELGTLGRGNHFLEFQADGEGRLWIMVHSGSRIMGQHITQFHAQRATASNGGYAWLNAESEQGRAYLNDLAWARTYAAQSRYEMLTSAAKVVTELLGPEPNWKTLLNTDHNHVQREQHGSDQLWVHRKGANYTPTGSSNLIPGSMATHSFHVEGRGHPEALTSSSHGAGRRLSRSAARSKIKRKDLEQQLKQVWIPPGTLGRLIDEAPAAYKDIDAVMRAQRDLVKIVRQVKPLICYKGV